MNGVPLTAAAAGLLEKPAPEATGEKTMTHRAPRRMTLVAGLLALLALLATLTLGAAPAALAAGPESGFFVGGGAHVLYVPGEGSWDGLEFNIKEPLTGDPDAPVGFFWSDNFLLGVKPMMGYRVNENLAFQATYSVNIPKTTQQSYSESTVNTYYEQGMQAEWRQRSIELVGVFQPSAYSDFFIYGGVDLLRVTMDVTLYEGVETTNLFGDLITAGEVQMYSDHLTTSGWLVGMGLEFPSQSEFSEVYVSAQYSTARSQGAFFGTPDFDVDLGGLSVTVGMRIYPF